MKQKEKFGKSSEKADPNQLDFLDIFNEAEIIKEPIVIVPELETVAKEHTRKKSKKGKAFENLETKQVHYGPMSRKSTNSMRCWVCQVNCVFFLSS